MRKLINIFFLIFISTNLVAQKFSSLYYKLRIQEDNTSFLPVTNPMDFNKEMFGIKYTIKPIISSSTAFGNLKFNNISLGFMLNAKMNNKINLLFDYGFYQLIHNFFFLNS